LGQAGPPLGPPRAAPHALDMTTHSATTPSVRPRCGNCVHFSNAPALMEETFRGLTTMSSGFGSVRAQDGLCTLHDYYLAIWDQCAEFTDKKAIPGDRGTALRATRD
jgi:hypothetical protein